MTGVSAPPRVFTFELPLPVNLGNTTFRHWGQKTQARTAYFARLDTLLLLRRLPRAPRPALWRAHAVIEVRTFRQMDEDNATSRTKWPIDWLKTRCFIADDSPAHLTLAVTPIVAPRRDCGITVRLEERP